MSVTLHKTILKHNLEEHNYYVRKPAKQTIVKGVVLRVEVSKKCGCVKGRVGYGSPVRSMRSSNKDFNRTKAETQHCSAKIQKPTGPQYCCRKSPLNFWWDFELCPKTAEKKFPLAALAEVHPMRSRPPKLLVHRHHLFNFENFLANAGYYHFFQNVSRKYYPCQRAQCPTRVTAGM